MSSDARLLVAVLIFLLNDLGFILISGMNGQPVALWFYSFDYVARIAALVLIWPQIRLLALNTVRNGWYAPKPSIIGDILLVFIMLLLSLFMVRQLFGWVESKPLFTYPFIALAPLRILDLTVGLALVAVSEELVFRAALMNRLKQILRRTDMTVVVSAIIFGAIHWGTGWGNSLTALALGIAFGMFYLSTRRVAPLIVVHYLFNLALFS